MPKNILIDLNVVLDLVLERPGFEAARDILAADSPKPTRLHISAHSITTFAYLLENAKVPAPERQRQVNWLLRLFTVIPTDEKLLQAALASRLYDYEDAVVEQAAVACQANLIITRNLKDFRHSAVPAVLPEAYLAA